ncbi:TCR/Tet family MFS transporter [Siphonobacter aquaeclarae]|jgi:DHA1 family tetracycline resistance protein-like MFS transporter|uniref:MFS transporter, DHA1 family, tetracycline resistance protein n=1 Tax=Siphonobacter aquaeclarae TaxID=563176 RepID=A0A1G9HZJ6_9BACT|nr:TCR/Tet family MFS transporter [Siphonobacter aquaeclarae]MBO9638804.1 TCR/Tet family MFS transporter [Siphonobacter aquaeclarae]SDL18265.1 MFS transporter, DHA1 family, tetracycline resistance protein [Siphonobacter aquaeclarae]
MAQPKRSAALVFIFITLLIDVTGLGIVIPVFPKLIEQLIHGNLSDASRYGGWLTFAYAAMQFLCAPVLGGLSDRFGRRPVLLASLFGFGLDYILQGLAPTIVWLFAGRLIAGITGASFTTASAYIADVSPPEKRAQNFGMVGAAFGAGFIIGPAIGGFLGSFGPRVPFFVAAGLSLANALYGYFILPESLAPENRRPFDWKRANPVGSLLHLRNYPIILSLTASMVCIYIAGHAMQSTWTFFTMERFGWDEKWVGLSLAAVGLAVGVVQGGLSRIIIPKLGQTWSVYVGLGLYVIGFICFAFADKGWMMFAFLVPYSLGGIAGPSLQGIISNQVPPTEQGELQGALTSLISLTSVVGPPLMTNLFAHFTAPTTSIYFPGAPFLAGAVLTVFSILFAARTLTKHAPA